ncbi:YeeE/YedE family protein [Bdellovibrio sp. HCB290]|uniref:YeeE/YedE family protein n=1 Tax=Bdellovibrio sp. HCB290 TaxID=3394356 RepID=UPI0039B577BA
MQESIMMALIGGLIIGVATSLLLALNGRVTGVSNILNGLLDRTPYESEWRWFFVFGMFFAGLVLNQFRPELFEVDIPRSSVMILIAGLLVGFGTMMGSGCTSGHGICGVARLSPRSIVATICFMIAGMLMANFLRWIVGL